MPLPPSAPPPSMWEEVVGASSWISVDFPWIWVDFLHMEMHVDFLYLQGIPKGKYWWAGYVLVLVQIVVVQDSAHPPKVYGTVDGIT